MSKLLFGIHMHQPVDNFGWVVQKAIKKCYRPFFEVASKYKEFRFNLHCSGWLLEEIKRVDSELFNMITSLVQGGTIEMLSAGYYEPILSSIPSKYRELQIKKLNSFIEENFNYQPNGIWLTERVWENSLITDLANSNIKYTLVDDYHFLSSGFDEKLLDGYYISEESASTLAIFPISQKLRYSIPFMSVDQAIKEIKSLSIQDDSAAIIFDDAEKFGLWPKTYEWVYEKRWLENFIEAILNDPQIETMHLSGYLDSYKPKGIAYLNNASYYEMGEWSLDAHSAAKLNHYKELIGESEFYSGGIRFLKGGIWKNFLVKYPYSNRLHKRMLELCSSIQNSSNESLLKLQTNDVFWHGVFGGLYLPNLRDNAYKYLIECENTLKQTGYSVDFNELDGYEKYKLKSKDLICRFDTFRGGALVELDARDVLFNYQNTLNRTKEFYHDKMLQDQKSVKQDNDSIATIHDMQIDVNNELKHLLVWDKNLKDSFLDHIVDETFCLNSFINSSFYEYAPFATSIYSGNFNNNTLTLNTKHSAITITKSFNLNGSRVLFTVNIDTNNIANISYMLELNFHFSDMQNIVLNGIKLDDSGEIKDLNRLEFYDNILNKKIIVSIKQDFKLYYFKLKTISQSEEGFDATIQGLSLALEFKTFSIDGYLEIV